MFPAGSYLRSQGAAVRQILRGPRLQARLTIGAPDDIYEQEADRVADAVMRMPEPHVQTKRPIEGSEVGIAFKASRNQSETIPYRTRMEQLFAADFSTVNSFRGQSELLAPFGACAAAWPESVAFASRTPPSHVVAHELSHVLQYRNLRSGSALRRGVAPRSDPAEGEARRATRQLMAAGLSLPLRTPPSAALMLYTDEEDLDSEAFLLERPPQFTNQEVGTWGTSWPATLVARERLHLSFPDEERSHAIVEAIAQRAAVVILREYGRLWLYRLEWEGLSARYSRFTNAETLFHEGTNERGNYSVSNVQGIPEVEAIVTEDGGVLSPPGAGKLFSHTGGEFEDPLVSKFHNARAFLGGLQRGLEGANFPGLAEKLRNMAALNTVFPAPFAGGALRGVANEIIELMQWLNPQQWKAVEAAARQTILILNDPDGEQLAATLGEEFGKTQAATLDTLLRKSLPVFAYEVGKLIGPTIIETVLAFIGIEIGPLTIIQKTLDAVGEVPRLVGVLRGAQRAFPEVPDRPGLPRPVAGESAAMSDTPAGDLPEPGQPPIPSPTPSRPDLSPAEADLLAKTGNRDEFPGALPKGLADRELAIVKRAEKVAIDESDGKYINEVDLGNGHKWKEQANGTWCRFSNGATNCTVLIAEPGPQDPGTVVAHALTEAELHEIYFRWAENRAIVNIEMAILKSRGAPGYPAGTYAVVVGKRGQVGFPEPHEKWETIAHSHSDAPNVPGYMNPSPADLEALLFGAFPQRTGQIQKVVHSQMPDGRWREVIYGYDFDQEVQFGDDQVKGVFYVQQPGGARMYFREIEDPRVSDDVLKEYAEWEKLLGREEGLAERLVEAQDTGDAEGLEKLWEEIGLVQEELNGRTRSGLIKRMEMENSENYYLHWYAQQFGLAK